MIPPPHVPPRPQVRRHYICQRALGPAVIDGDVDKPFWRHAPWTGEFVDIEGDIRSAPRHATRVKMLWDDECLYVLADMDEPHLWATLSEHDSVVYHDNDFEVFVSPTGDNHRYYELEINALGTVFDLFMAKPYRDGGPADHGFNFDGLRKAVRLRGTLNDPRDVDDGWSVELAFPWSAFDRHGGGGGPPRIGDLWRMNFSRVQWDLVVLDGRYYKESDAPEHNWVWSPQGLIDMHRPEMWGYVHFWGPGGAAPAADAALAAKEELHRVYYAQKAHHANTGRWASSLSELGHAPGVDPALRGGMELNLSADGWIARRAVDVGGRMETWSIRHDSLLQRDRA